MVRNLPPKRAQSGGIGRLALVAWFLVILTGLLTPIMLRPPTVPEIFGVAPNFTLAGEDGQPYLSANLEGKVTALNFFFTECEQICPATAAQIKKLAARFEGYDDVQFLSVSVDPKDATPSTLAAYARKLNADPRRWRFVAGPLDDVRKIADQLNLAMGDTPSLHSNRIILIDTLTRIRGYYDIADDEALNRVSGDIKVLLRHRS